MQVVLPTGYIVESAGPYYADSYNNDAAIMKKMLGEADFRATFRPGDCMVVDRGFRDVLLEMTDAGYSHYMPHLLAPKQKQFTTKEANESRRVRY